MLADVVWQLQGQSVGRMMREAHEDVVLGGAVLWPL